MCGFTETYGLGRWYAEPLNAGTWIKVVAYRTRRPSEIQQGAPRKRELYMRLHDAIPRTPEGRREAIERLRAHDWQVEACFTITRCYTRHFNYSTLDRP